MCNMPGGGHGHGGGHGFGHGQGWGYGHGCCSPHGMGHHCPGMGWRRFMSPAEKLERLHEYLDQLKKEVAGVEAMIHEMKGK